MDGYAQKLYVIETHFKMDNFKEAAEEIISNNRLFVGWYIKTDDELGIFLEGFYHDRKIGDISQSNGVYYFDCWLGYTHHRRDSLEEMILYADKRVRYQFDEEFRNAGGVSLIKEIFATKLKQD